MHDRRLLLGAARRAGLALACATLLTAPAAAGEPVRIVGRVVVAETGEAAAGAEVQLSGTGLRTAADRDGSFAILLDKRPAEITLVARLGLRSGGLTVTLPPGDAEPADISLPGPIGVSLRPGGHEYVTVTAGRDRWDPGRIGPAASFSAEELADGVPTLAELLEEAPGVAVRSLGPGAARPIIRGFDGDRVVILEDGIRAGDLSSQAAEHGVAANPSLAERVELLRGPAALLYGPTTTGGVVNLVSTGSRLALETGPGGFSAGATLAGGTVDRSRRAEARAHARGDRWFAWGAGSASRSEDYRSPDGPVPGSAAAADQGEAGFGLRGARAWGSVSARVGDSRFGVPLAGQLHGEAGDVSESVEVAAERRQLRADLGLHDPVPGFDRAEITLRLSDFVQEEIETDAGGFSELETQHENRSLVFRGDLHRDGGRFRGRAGVWARIRDFISAGEEALAPDTRQRAAAAFALGEYEAASRLSVLFSARVERNAYDAADRPIREEEDDDDDDAPDEPGFEPPPVVDRGVSGVSGSAGLRLDLGSGTHAIASATVSTRPPALEELYNFGLDAGIQAFEIGDPFLEPERARGVDLTLRRETGGFAGAASFFFHDIDGFTYGRVRGGHGGVTVISTEQADARHLGFELDAAVRLGSTSLAAAASFVDARLTARNEPVPRIPPLNGHLSWDIPLNRWNLSPRLGWAAAMDRPHPGETRTAGHAVLDLALSFDAASEGRIHRLVLIAHNLTNADHRDHTSVIKDIAAQPGRGIRLSYSLRLP